MFSHLITNKEEWAKQNLQGRKTSLIPLVPLVPLFYRKLSQWYSMLQFGPNQTKDPKPSRHELATAGDV
jgi:hypothetical protein